jgi:hypothetical protein
LNIAHVTWYNFKLSVTISTDFWPSIIEDNADCTNDDVMFPKKEDWASLYGNYSNLKDMLTQKYGTPIWPKAQDRPAGVVPRPRCNSRRADCCGG